MRNPRISEICRLYREFDRKTAAVQLASGLRCPPGCGRCCSSSHVEASILEVLPAAEEVYLRDEADSVLAAIERKDLSADPICVFHILPADPSRTGCCSYYPVRPLICRLFGFAARTGKSGNPEFRPCKWALESDPASAGGASGRLFRELDLPIYQESSMRVASIDPAMGFQRLPINVAVRRAIEYLYWKRPLPKNKKAAA